MNVTVIMEVVNMTVLILREATTVLVIQGTQSLVIITTVLVCLLHKVKELTDNHIIMSYSILT